ncbi:MAG: hypothetical protein ACK49N_12235 [Verrucomicrobiota bacterium]
MKHLITIAVVGAAAYFGYKFEPDLRLAITGIPYGVGHKMAINSLPNVDLATLRPDQLPKEVTIFSTIPVKDQSTGIIINLPANSKLQPVKITPPNVQLLVKGTKYKIVLPIDKTDLIEQLSLMPLDTAPPPAPAEPEPEPEPAAPEPPPAEPTPIAAPTPTAPIGPVDPVKLMRETLQKKPIKEFSIGQVTTWSPGPEETIDGETFATGVISYEATTILGQKTMQAKALIKNGSIQKWTHAKSGIEIK